jgi:hypothetical protein
VGVQADGAEVGDLAAAFVQGGVEGDEHGEQADAALLGRTTPEMSTRRVVLPEPERP